VHDPGIGIQDLALMRNTNVESGTFVEGIHHIQITPVAADFAGTGIHGGCRSKLDNFRGSKEREPRRAAQFSGH